MKQRSRIWDVGLGVFFVVLISATIYAALQPTAVEPYTAMDSDQGLRLKMNRNQEKLQNAARFAAVVIDTNRVQRSGHTKIYGGTFIGHDTVSLPEPYVDADFVINPTLKYVYGDTPTCVIALPIDSSRFEVWLVGATDSNIIQWSTVGSMLGR
jgi:hypothetical protein